MQRYLYHAILRPTVVDDAIAFAPASLATEGFVHCSFASVLRESVRLYLPKVADVDVLQIDPRRLSARVAVDDTPRGPMPHVYGPLDRAAIVARIPFTSLPDELPDVI